MRSVGFAMTVVTSSGLIIDDEGPSHNQSDG